ncbi:MAG: hypothetical protein ACYDEA_01700 [Candidatus Dormibacteria bacterium]
MNSINSEPDLEQTRLALEGDSEAAMELRFEVFMDELEAHADPTFGDGKHPEINRAAQTLMDALHAAFTVERKEQG